MCNSSRCLKVVVMVMFLAACATTYKAKPLPFKSAASYPNATQVAGTTVGAEAFVDEKSAKEAFGFDIRGAGMLPVQVVFDNQGSHAMEINAAQTFLEDDEGNLWPVLNSKTAYERAGKFSKTKEIFKEGAYGGFLGATAGALIGGAVGIVTGENAAEAVGKGAAVGAAAGSTMGGIKGYSSDEARRAIINDLNDKSLQNKSVKPNSLAHGVIFFPGEAKSAKRLRIQLVETDTKTVHTLMLNL